MRIGSVLLIVLATVLGAACKFPELPAIEEDAASDAGSPDAGEGPAALTTPSGSHDFGSVVIGSASPLLQVTVTNSGGDPSGPLSVAVLGASSDQFEVVPTGNSSDCVSARLSGGTSCTAQVRYAPSTNTVAAARLEVSGNPGGTATVQLSGDALTPASLESTQGSYDFGDIVMGQQSSVLQVVVSNSGEEPSGSLTVTLTGSNPGDFEIVPTGMSNDCSGRSLGQPDTCVAQVRFHPSVASSRSATLTIMGSPGGSVTVPVSGRGLSPGNLVVDLPTGGAPLDFGTRELGTGATSTPQTIRIRNSGGTATGALAVTITGGGAASYTLPVDGCNGGPLGAGATCDVQVRFNPAAVGNQPAIVTVRDIIAMTAASVSVTGVGSARVALTKTGLGTVTSSPAGLSCGTGCSSQTQPFTQTPIGLTATPDAGWVFTSWSGACSGANPIAVCSLPLDQGLKSVGVLFTQVFVLATSTTGAGTLTSSPPGILCGNSNTDCMETYPVGTMVQLTAEPDSGWEVYAWSGTGGSCGVGTRNCTVTMSQARNVTVEFRRTYTLSVAVTGSGQGSVTGTFTGGSVNCATGSTGTCSSPVFDGTSVTLTQTPGSTGVGSQIVFAGWGSDCSGSGTMTTCTLMINGAKSVGAAFTLQHRLTLTVSGASTGAGTITANPGAFTCMSGTCTRYYDAGANLTVSAVGASQLDGLGSVTGDCSASPCSLNAISSPRSVTVTFVRYQCVPTTKTCSAGRYTECDAGGDFVTHVVPNGASDGSALTLVMDQYQCPMGCHTSQPRCADINAANGLNAVFDTSAVGSTGLDLVLPANAGSPGVTVIDTSSYNAGTGTTNIVDADGSTLVVPAQVVTQTGAPEILVLKLRTFTVRSGRTVEVRGSRALAIASHFDIFVAGTIDLSAVGGSLSEEPYSRPGPGMSTRSNCNGVASGSGAFGGGGNYDNGGNGSQAGSTGGAGFPSGLQPLEGGCGGGYSENGGGALQLSSRTRIGLGPSSLIDVGGAGGNTLFFGAWFGSGGGSGGGVLIEAPSTQFTAGTVIAGRGGSGAASNSASVRVFGADGPTTGTTPAPARTCSGCGTSGAGGTELAAPTNATGSGSAVASGGGAVGRCVTRNATGIVTPPSGMMKIRHITPTGVLSPRSP